MKNPFRGRDNQLGVALLFLAPNIIGFLIFTAWPIIASLLLSFCSWDLLTPPRWIGFGNFYKLLGFHGSPDGLSANDPDFWRFFGNTLYLMLSLPLIVFGSLFFATILNRKLHFSYGYRLIFYLPHIVSGIAIFYLWRWMYNPDYGLINSMLGEIGVHGPKWLSSTRWAKPALLIMIVWLGVGGTSMIMYLAALQGVPHELYEASQIDGANGWQRFWAVTWPSVKPVTFFIVTTGLIGGFQSGAEMAFVMTNGGPNGATTTLGYYIYQNAFSKFQMGYAAAISWFLFIVVFTITLLNWRRSGRSIDL